MVDNAASTKGLPPAVDSPDGSTRIECLVAMIDHCNVAKDVADRLGEKFLSYLLAMAIQEATARMREKR